MDLAKKENIIELEITKKELGVLETNAQKIKEEIEGMLPNYDAIYYDEDNIEDAKKDKAMLNNIGKTLNSERIKIEKEFLKPFESFKDTVKETCAMIKTASSNIDSIVKEVDEKEKTKNKAIIKGIFDENNLVLKGVLDFEKIFNDKWLNKSAWKKDEFQLEEELINKIKSIQVDIEMINNMNSEFDLTIKNKYFEDFNLTDAVELNKTLIARKEELSNSELTKVKENIVIGESKEIKKELLEKLETEDIDPIKNYQLDITAPLSKIKELKRFMELNDIKYKKIEGEK